MTTRARKTILGDSTNTYYNNYNNSLPELTHAKSFTKPTVRLEIRPQYSFDSSTPSTEDNTPSTCSNDGSFVFSQNDFGCENYEPSSMYSLDQNEDYLNSAMRNKKKTAVTTDDTKYKTELCKNWVELGKCNYGKKCRFAHGKHELVEKHVTNRCRYKSKKCNSFFTTMFCPYGVRCMFAHEQRTLPEINSVNHYGKYLDFPELMEDPCTRNKSRLSVFENLEQFGSIDGSFAPCFFDSSEISFGGNLSLGYEMFSL